MNRRGWAAVAAGVAAVIGATLLANPSSARQLLSPWLRETFAFSSAYADPNPKVLVVKYWDSGCPSEAVRQHAQQEPSRVVVTLTRTPFPNDLLCTSIAVPMLVRIPLTAPLGSRTVIEGSRDTPVPVFSPPPSGS